MGSKRSYVLSVRADADRTSAKIGATMLEFRDWLVRRRLVGGRNATRTADTVLKISI